MPRWYPLLGLSLAAGLALALHRLAWFRTRPTVVRLAPYVPATRSRRRRTTLSADSLREIIGPLAIEVGNRLANLVGVNEDLSIRLQRGGSPLDPTGFRLRQGAWAVASVLGASSMSALAQLPPALILAATLAAPVLAFLVIEHQMTAVAERWQQELTLELPVVAEQLGMLLSSGYSLGSAITRMGKRGRGHAAVELARISRRIRQGVGELDALREWAEYSGVASIERLVSVLALNWEASDLGTLISNEARSVRRDVQRTQIELIERRAQQVWIPVTVATLLPGVIFMTVPFLAAMSALTGG
ncbi:MAG: hypothetical protein GX868_02425 [Actinobacteria bacterium]|nr:hypothetical protein [Actinomycetota bacterium]